MKKPYDISVYKKIYTEEKISIYTNDEYEYSDESCRKDNKLIPVTVYFKNGYSYPEYVKNYIENLFVYEYEKNDEEYQKLWNSLPTKIIPLKRIIPTQNNIDSRKLFDRKLTSDTPKAHFVLFNHYYYLLDGHHRIASMIKHGQQIKGKVLHVKK